MLYVDNTQCDAQNAECHIHTTAFMQPPFKFWSSARHYSHLIPLQMGQHNTRWKLQSWLHQSHYVHLYGFKSSRAKKFFSSQKCPDELWAHPTSYSMHTKVLPLNDRKPSGTGYTGSRSHMGRFVIILHLLFSWICSILALFPFMWWPSRQPYWASLTNLSDPSSPLSDMPVKHTDSVSKILFHTKKKWVMVRAKKLQLFVTTTHSKIINSFTQIKNFNSLRVLTGFC